MLSSPTGKCSRYPSLKSKDSKELIEIMEKEYPSFDKDSFDLSLGAKVAKGEMKW